MRCMVMDGWKQQSGREKTSGCDAIFVLQRRVQNVQDEGKTVVD